MKGTSRDCAGGAGLRAPLSAVDMTWILTLAPLPCQTSCLEVVSAGTAPGDGGLSWSACVLASVCRVASTGRGGWGSPSAASRRGPRWPIHHAGAWASAESLAPPRRPPGFASPPRCAAGERVGLEDVRVMKARFILTGTPVSSRPGARGGGGGG